MGKILQQIQELARQSDVRVSAHGYDELAADGLLALEVIGGIAAAVAVEEYPDYPKGPCVLALQHTLNGTPIHVVWGIPKAASRPAVLVTAYRPDPAKWSADFMQRNKP